jgi:hypothetical protein
MQRLAFILKMVSFVKGSSALTPALVSPMKKLFFLSLIALSMGSFAQAQSIYIGGSNVAKIEDDGDVYIGGSFKGRFEDDGDVYIGGSYAGKIEDDGDVYINGSFKGKIEDDGDVYIGGSYAGKVEDDGDIYEGGSSKGRGEHIRREWLAGFYFFFFTEVN